MFPSDLQKYRNSRDPFSNVALFDLDTDPAETTNLAGKYPNLVEELLKEAEGAIKDAPRQVNSMVRCVS